MGRDAEKDLAMCEAATPGPWQAWRRNGDFIQLAKGVVVGTTEDNLQFISESREALPYWIKRAMAAEAEVERLREERDYLLSVQEVIDQVAENAEVYSAEYVNRLSQAAKEREKKLVEALQIIKARCTDYCAVGVANDTLKELI